MLLPFVRELFADVEQLPGFTRAASHLRESAGRIRVTGLSPTAKALITVLLRRAVERPFLLVVADNRAAEDLLPVLRAFAELTGAADPDSVVSLPALDVLPFQNLSPHPEIQEERATALWKISTARASIVVAPVGATTIRLRSADYYADLARVLRRGESFDLERLLQHMNTVGYTSADVVEMPGQYAVRGGIHFRASGFGLLASGERVAWPNPGISVSAATAMTTASALDLIPHSFLDAM